MQTLIKDRKKLILLISLCIFAAALAYRITHPYKQKRVAELTFSTDKVHIPMAKTSQRNNKPVRAENYVKLELFTDPPPHSRDIIKNIFFEEKVAPVNEKPAVKAETKPKIPEKIVAPAVNKRRQVEKDLSRFKSFGYLESDGEMTLFLERGKQILVIRKGDRIDGKYLVKDITKEELNLTAKSINEDVHINLGQLK